MTSANLSLVDKLKLHRTYVGRTLWISLVAIPFFAVYYIFGTIMMVTRSINYASYYHQSAEQLQYEKLNAVSSTLGFGQIGWIMIIAAAFLFAIQGFSYLFNESQIDFYLSQPTTRAQRIRKNYVNAITTFILIYVTTVIIGLIAASIMGAVNGNIVMEVAIETLRAFVLFFAFYNITVLAVVISGSLPIAIIMTAVLSFLSIVISGETSFYKDMFFATSSPRDQFNVFLSPIFDRASVMSSVNLFISQGGLLQDDYISKCLKILFAKDLDILITGVIAFSLVIFFSKFRQAEWTGKSIPLRPVRWCIKILTCVLMGLGSGYFIYLVYITVWNTKIYLIMLAVMVFVTIFTGCITEVILEGNIKRLFKGMAQTIMSIAIVILVFVICRGDLLGYDSYVPAVNKIESCAILNTTRTMNFTDKFGNYSDNYNFANDMKITNVEDFVQIAKVGMKQKKQERLKEQEGNYDSIGYPLSIMYRLKNGRKIYREIVVPYETVDEQLDRIISSEEYKVDNFQVFKDENIRDYAKSKVNSTLKYVSGGLTKETKSFDYAQFSDAYRQDLLLHYNFREIKEKLPIGNVTYESNDYNNYCFADFEVFDTFENTIALLKEYGIYTDMNSKDAEIKRVVVTNYYPGYDLDELGTNNIDIKVEAKTVDYYDKESIEKILDSAVSTDYYNIWYNYNNNDSQYNIQIFVDGKIKEYEGAYYSFLKGKVPGFVEEDTNR